MVTAVLEWAVASGRSQMCKKLPSWFLSVSSQVSRNSETLPLLASFPNVDPKSKSAVFIWHDKPNPFRAREVIFA